LIPPCRAAPCSHCRWSSYKARSWLDDLLGARGESGRKGADALDQLLQRLAGEKIDIELLCLRIGDEVRVLHHFSERGAQGRDAGLWHGGAGHEGAAHILGRG